LKKLGVVVSGTSVRNVLRRHRLKPAPRRSGPTFTQFLRAQAAGTTQLDDASDGFLFGLDRPGVAVVARVE